MKISKLFGLLLMILLFHSVSFAEREVWLAIREGAHTGRIVLHPNAGNSVLKFYRYMDSLELWRFTGVFKSRESEFSHLELNQYVQSLEDLVARWIYHQRNAILLSEAMYYRFYSDINSNPLPRHGLQIEELQYVLIAHDWAKFSAAEKFWRPYGATNVWSHPIFNLAIGYGRTWTAEEKKKLGDFDRIDQEEQHRRIVEVSGQPEKTQGRISYSPKGELIQFLEHAGDVVERWGSKGGESPEGMGIGREEYRKPAYPLENDHLLKTLFKADEEYMIPAHLSRRAQVEWLRKNYSTIIGDPIDEKGDLAVYQEIERWVKVYFQLVRVGNTSWRENSGMDFGKMNRYGYEVSHFKPSSSNRVEFSKAQECVSALGLPY